MANNDGSWHLDKRVPISILGGIILQTIVFSYWMGTLNERVLHNSDELERRKAEVARIAVIETRLNSLNSSIRRLNNTMERYLQSRFETHQRSNGMNGQ